MAGEEKKSLKPPNPSKSAGPASGFRPPPGLAPSHVPAPGGGVKSIPPFQFGPSASYFARFSASLKTS